MDGEIEGLVLYARSLTVVENAFYLSPFINKLATHSEIKWSQFTRNKMFFKVYAQPLKKNHRIY